MPSQLRPVLYDDANQLRSVYTTARKAILDENFDEIMEEWIATNAGDEATHTWGIPDTAMNPLANNTRQLVTPGLYGKPVKLRYNASAEGLLGSKGALNTSGFWQRAQTLQYFTVGMGIYFRKLNVVDSGYGPELVDRLVCPDNIVAFVSDANPMEPLAVWELRCRQYAGRTGKPYTIYVYDQYDISDPANPRFSIVRVDNKGRPTDDVTAAYVDGEGVYDWISPDGRPFLPWVVYRAVDTGEFWPMYRRGMHRGTLRSCEHWTYTSRSALFATGEHVLIGGADPDGLPGVSTKRGDDNVDPIAAPQQSMRVVPGMITFVPTMEGKNLSSIPIGPGVNLPNLATFSNMYQMILALGDGLHPTDATRTSANPTSGAALEISAESLRAHSAQVEPFFRRSDTEAIQKTSWMYAAVGEDYPVEDVVIEYETIPLTPQEREDLRKDLEWRRDNGLISSVDVMMRLHPTLSREQARKAVIEAQVEEAEVKAEVLNRVPKPPVDPATLGGRVLEINPPAVPTAPGAPGQPSTGPAAPNAQ
jgi:hypothetical protein